ncbi:palmitoyltransferase ZDHHC16 isoform X2 [Echinops telfairi]|uniref:Palmitoyltransferase ZDHHC16 isoform X2 n=1 Tax=Echinops telfairi TaxID=9371 RepID=A0AC55D6W5_ECHTE|nr:palmitoyltransferase ZDHHC16 isoform X2 [Echinops telfairi]
MRSQRGLLLGPARLCLRLLLLLGYRRRCPPLLRGLVQRWRYGKVCLRSLMYNSFGGSDTAVEAAFEPVYWLVDNVIRWFGVVFVVLVVVLTSSIVAIAYLCVLPLILQTYSVPRLCWHFFYSHWNLILIVFHYYQAITTPPGYPPQGRNDIAAVSICKKCIYPKPARTHHCSICNRMLIPVGKAWDWPPGRLGHCNRACVPPSQVCAEDGPPLPLPLTCVSPAWLNNCVGHYNHRHFFSFCFFMTLGCVYCSYGSWDLFREAYAAIETYHQTPPPTFSFRERITHKSLIYLWFLCSSVALALGALTAWHAVLISRGETSIERHINKKERRRLQARGRVSGAGACKGHLPSCQQPGPARARSLPCQASTELISCEVGRGVSGRTSWKRVPFGSRHLRIHITTAVWTTGRYSWAWTRGGTGSPGCCCLPVTCPTGTE